MMIIINKYNKLSKMLGTIHQTKNHEQTLSYLSSNIPKDHKTSTEILQAQKSQNKSNKNIGSNSNYVLDRLYPEYSPKNRNHPQTSHALNIEKKMLMVLYQLDRNIQEEQLLRRGKNRGREQRSRERAVSLSNNQSRANIQKQNNYGHKAESKKRRIVTEASQQMLKKMSKAEEESDQYEEQGNRNSHSILQVRSLSEKNYKLHKNQKIQKSKIGSHEEKSTFLPKIAKNMNTQEEYQEESKYLRREKSNQTLLRNNLHLTKTLDKKLLLQQIQKSTKEDNKLGRLVLQKVEKHFDMEKRQQNLYTEGNSHFTLNYQEENQTLKNKIHYFQRVKSEEDIDDTLIKYLKNKVKQADLIIQSNNEDASQHEKLKGKRKNKSRNKVKKDQTKNSSRNQSQAILKNKREISKQLKNSKQKSNQQQIKKHKEHIKQQLDQYSQEFEKQFEQKVQIQIKNMKNKRKNGDKVLNQLQFTLKQSNQ